MPTYDLESYFEHCQEAYSVFVPYPALGRGLIFKKSLIQILVDTLSNSYSYYMQAYSRFEYFTINTTASTVYNLEYPCNQAPVLLFIFKQVI